MLPKVAVCWKMTRQEVEDTVHMAVRKGLSEKVAFEQRSHQCKKASFAEVW